VIRARRQEDLDRLCAIAEEVRHRAGLPPTSDLAGWLDDPDAEQSWVYDMAPVRVTPTRNVVGHVQILRPREADPLVACTKEPAGRLLVIGKLFVRRDRHEDGFRWYLLKEAVNYIRRQGRVPALDRNDSWFLATALCHRLGFEELPPPGPGIAPMIHTQ
jgi:hypothetical protein